MNNASRFLRRRDLGMIVALAALVLAVYWPVGGYGFVNYDDPEFVTNVPILHEGFSVRGVQWALTTDYQSHWQPLVWLSYMFDTQFFGLAPGGHHLVNVVLHILAAVLLFLVLRAVTAAEWPSAAVAALFALHPLHVESVAWISERKDVLSTVFWMLSMGAYVAWTRRQTWGRYLWVMLFLALGLMSKPMLVTLPFVLLLLDYWPLGRLAADGGVTTRPDAETPGGVRTEVRRLSVGRLILEKWPLFVLVAVSSGVTYLGQRHNNATEFGATLSLGTRLASAVVAYATYLVKTVCPINLCVLYPYNDHLPLWQVIGSGVLLAAITVLVIRQARRGRPYLAVGWFWFLGTLVPVSGIVQVGLQSMADRYTYVPLVGLFIMAAFGLADVARAHPSAGRLLGGLGAAAMVAMGLLASGQVRVWQDSETLWHRAVAAAPDGNYVARNNLAAALIYRGEFKEAVRLEREAVAIREDYADGHETLGVALVYSGSLAEAIQEYRTALDLKPDRAKFHANLAAALAMDRQFDEAIDEARIALDLDPHLPGARATLDLALTQTGRARKPYREKLSP
jgi:protein O-mannosyl-transferase